MIDKSKYKLKKLSRPLTVGKLLTRLNNISGQIFLALEINELQMEYSALSQLLDDKALRQSTAEALLCCTLWIEAGKQSIDIVGDCAPETRKLLAYMTDCFAHFVATRSLHLSKEVSGHENLALIWTHLFVEFRWALGLDEMAWLWRPVLRPLKP